jgi:hypothetical protein
MSIDERLRVTSNIVDLLDQQDVSMEIAIKTVLKNQLWIMNKLMEQG